MFNSRMGAGELKEFCALGSGEEAFMARIYKRRGLSARTYHKVLKVARTIADLEGGGPVRKPHLAEAAGYRALEDKIWES